MEVDYVQPCGLGARDSLRLEAGLCLYGHELEEDITPREAVLMWVVNKARRADGRATFLGASKVLDASQPLTRKRIGFVVEGGPPVREGVKLFHEDKEIGRVTSGCPSPSLGNRKSVGMGYVPPELATVGTKLEAEVRGKRVPISVEKMPFVPAKYYKALA